MGKEVIFDNGKMTVWYYDDCKVIHHRFNELIHGQDFRDGFTKGLEVLKEKGAVKWLGEEGKTKVLGREDQDWAGRVWNTQMLEAGWKYWAMVQPKSVTGTGKLFAEKMIKDYANLGVTVKIFEDVDSALDWLREQG
ncbi:MAG: hypothetical protein JW864_09970 [Spirochaetes bacterium]|nr:hypothetical protein [Spirochaetota bacterium]